MKVEFECYDCGHTFEVSKRKAKYMAGIACPKCNGRLLPHASTQTELTKKDTTAVVDALFETISSTLRKRKSK